MLGNVDSQIETIENSLYTAKSQIKNFQSSKPAPKQQGTAEQDAPKPSGVTNVAPDSVPKEKEPDIVGFSKAPAKPVMNADEQRQKPNVFSMSRRRAESAPKKAALRIGWRLF